MENTAMPKIYEGAATSIETLVAKYEPKASVIAARFEMQKAEIARQVEEATKG